MMKRPALSSMLNSN